jgi:site-specific DNA recombinase
MTTSERTSVNGSAALATKAKIAVGYIRISDPRQGTGSEITQTQQVLNFIESEGFTFGGMYADEESGLLEMRPDYQRMIQGARDGDFQVVVIPRFDRFGRDDAEYFPRLREFSRLGIEVLSATEPNGNNFVRGILILMANEESRRISMRIIPNKARRAREGFWTGHPVLGYDLCRLMPDGTLIPSNQATLEQKNASPGAVLVPNQDAPWWQSASRGTRKAKHH